ncbi:DNA-binding protein [ANME-1 cluster archaeon GoMg2]|nr:DNA-binding protein [ANME-1 cluster archaeon GoMg2]
MASEDELEGIRKRKYEEMLQSQAGAAAEEEKRQELDEAKKNIIRQVLTTDARERLNNIKMAKPEFADVLENQLIGLAQTGRLKGKIDDTQLKELLRQIMPKKREISITRV